MQRTGLTTFWDVIRLMRSFGAYIYTGDRRADIILMQSELKDLYDDGLLLKEDYLMATLIIKNELSTLTKEIK
ncbi:YqgQ family protein [Sporosarcina aquimarina]|uniref:YqgQ family protein n=1 Tax=Sporosarcina aquimarina TaxID=114975 RepID=UPI00295EBEF2|nr:YqgQ family protein [Sporosarcina aquimarina]